MSLNAKQLYSTSPELMNAWYGVSAAVEKTLDPTIRELVKVRASQINGCANCINMHAQFAREAGETEQRLYLLPAWREAPCYTERERAALGWAEALVRQSEGHDLKEARTVLESQFSQEEQIALTMVINVINGWNRLAVGFGVFIDPDEARAAAAA